MEIHLHHAQSLGELIVDGRHKPFRALACPLKPVVLRDGSQAKRHQRFGCRSRLTHHGMPIRHAGSIRTTTFA